MKVGVFSTPWYMVHSNPQAVRVCLFLIFLKVFNFLSTFLISMKRQYSILVLHLSGSHCFLNVTSIFKQNSRNVF